MSTTTKKILNPLTAQDLITFFSSISNEVHFKLCRAATVQCMVIMNGTLLTCMESTASLMSMQNLIIDHGTCVFCSVVSTTSGLDLAVFHRVSYLLGPSIYLTNDTSSPVIGLFLMPFVVTDHGIVSSEGHPAICWNLLTITAFNWSLLVCLHLLPSIVSIASSSFATHATVLLS